MTKTKQSSAVVRLGLVLSALTLAASGSAHALPLPDNSNCSAAGICLKVKNTAAGGVGIAGESTSGLAVVGTSASGTGVYGTTNGSSAAVLGYSVGGHGVYGSTSATSNSVAGVYGLCGSTTGNCRGVKGFVQPSTQGIAVLGDAQNSGTAWAGYFLGDVSAQEYFNFSDARLKKNIKDMRDGTASILKLRPVTYQWKREEAGAEQLGLIAQEVQAVFPNAVREDKETGMLAVNYVAMVPVLIKSVQEQQATIERLEARIAKLEKRDAPMTVSSLTPSHAWLAGVGLLPLALIGTIRRRKIAA